jgi:hypothetical protein
MRGPIMPDLAIDVKPLIRYLLHIGLVEIRYLAFEPGHESQINKLADVLEFLPRFLADDREPHLDVIRDEFESYAKQFPHSLYASRYLEYVNGREVPTDY